MTQTVEISVAEYIELLQYKLEALLVAQGEDCSWNYGIKELEEQIAKLKKPIDESTLTYGSYPESNVR